MIDLEAIKKRLEHRADSRWGIHDFNDHAPTDIAALLAWVEKLEAFKENIRLIFRMPDKVWELALEALAALEAPVKGDEDDQG